MTSVTNKFALLGRCCAIPRPVYAAKWLENHAKTNNKCRKWRNSWWLPECWPRRGIPAIQIDENLITDIDRRKASIVPIGKIDWTYLEIVGLKNSFVNHKAEHELGCDADGEEDGSGAEEEHETFLFPVALWVVVAGRLGTVGRWSARW